MESRYKLRIIDQFRDLPLPEIENLDIPDEYQYMDPELVDLIQKMVESHIKKIELNKR